MRRLLPSVAGRVVLLFGLLACAILAGCGPRAAGPQVRASPAGYPPAPDPSQTGDEQTALRDLFSSVYAAAPGGAVVDRAARNPLLCDNPAAPGWPTVFHDHFIPRPERARNLWVVQTRDCPQEMGSDPWPALRVLHFNDRGCLAPFDPAQLLAQAGCRPVLIQVHGNLITPDAALGMLLWTDTWLTRHQALAADTLIVAFDWPSSRVTPRPVVDLNEKARRAFVAGYHLARFLQAFPPHARVCLLGHSYGGRVIPTALHLLAGGAVADRHGHSPTSLEGGRTDVRLRAVVASAAIDHDWLDPGRRLGAALAGGTEGLLNLYNSRDEALLAYPLLASSGHHAALGRTGLHPADRKRLGPLARRVVDYDTAGRLGREHTLLGVVGDPELARLIAPYAWASPGDAVPAP